MFDLKSKSQYIYACIVVFLCGNLVFGLLYSYPFFLYGCFAAIILMLIFLGKIRQWFLILVSFFLGAIHLSSVQVSTLNDPLYTHIGVNEIVRIEAVVVDEAIEDGKKAKTRIQPYSINGEQVNSRLALNLYSDSLEVYQFSDHLVIDGRIVAPPEFESFDYKNFLRKDGVIGEVYYPHLVKHDANQKIARRQLFDIKRNIIGVFKRNIPEPESSLLSGLIIGDRSGFSDELQDAFNKTGMTHIVAVSGYNTALIVSLLMSVLVFVFKRQHVTWIAILFLIVFVVITGSSASVVRAALMAGIILIAVSLKRVGGSKRALLLSAFCITIVNPFMLLHDVGFQLSFLSTAGILFYAERFDSWLSFVPKWFSIRESLSLTLISLFATLPISLLTFKGFSLMSLPANILIAPFVPASMFFGFVGMCIEVVAPGIALFFWYISYTFLHMIIVIVEHLSRWQFSYIQIEHRYMYIAIGVLWCIIISYFWYVEKKNKS